MPFLTWEKVEIWFLTEKFGSEINLTNPEISYNWYSKLINLLKFSFETSYNCTRKQAKSPIIWFFPSPIFRSRLTCRTETPETPMGVERAGHLRCPQILNFFQILYFGRGWLAGLSEIHENSNISKILENWSSKGIHFYFSNCLKIEKMFFSVPHNFWIFICVSGSEMMSMEGEKIWWGTFCFQLF